jgi:hypothetical protein
MHSHEMKVCDGMKVWRYMLATAMLSACGANTQSSDVRQGSGVPALVFDKVVVLYVGRDPGFRRSVENELARRIPRAVPAYTVRPRVDVRDRDRAKARMQAAGFDGAILVQVIKVGNKVPFELGSSTLVSTARGGMWRDWNNRWGAAWDPHDFGDDAIVRMETNVYSVPNGRLVWSNRSNAYDPSAVPTATSEIAAATVDQLKQEAQLTSLSDASAAESTARR